MTRSVRCPTLHNNARMTWGKAIIGWTPEVETAWAMMLDLNHRYALDGRNPSSSGFSVTLYEKARGAGGRMSTRRAGVELRFDHGARYFTVRDPRFERYVEAWKAQSIVQHWDVHVAATGRDGTRERSGTAQRWAGVGGMNAVCKHLARELDVRLETRVEKIRRDGRRWRLWRDDGQILDSFDAVAVAVPAPQAAGLLAEVPSLAAQAAGARMSGCWAVMAAFESPIPAKFDRLFVNEGPLSWVARDSSKPGRPPAPDCRVLHASPEWSDEHLADDAELVSEALMEAFWEAVGEPRAAVAHVAAHRWRYSLPVATLS